MSKGRYRSVECKQVRWEEVIEQASGRAVVFAIDVAKEAFVGLLQAAGGEDLVRYRENPAAVRGRIRCRCRCRCRDRD
jgi:hypothetical protein